MAEEKVEKVIDPENFSKAFEFISQQLALFKLSRQEHVLIDQIIRQARAIGSPPPTEVPKVVEDNPDPKEALARQVQKDLTAKK